MIKITGTAGSYSVVVDNVIVGVYRNKTEALDIALTYVDKASSVRGKSAYVATID